MGKESALLGVAFVAIVFGCLLECSSVSCCTDKDRLVRDLTQSYLTSVEPDKSVLKISLAFICSRFDKVTGELVSNVWEKLTWSDKRLRWTPQEYNGIELIRLPKKLIWVPDMKLYNSLSPIEDRDLTNAVVYHDGKVVWVPPAVYRTLCSGRSCQFKIGSWTYDADILKLELDDPAVDASSYMNSTCPLVFETGTAAIQTNYYPCCPEPYSYAEFNVDFKP